MVSKSIPHPTIAHSRDGLLLALSQGELARAIVLAQEACARFPEDGFFWKALTVAQWRSGAIPMEAARQAVRLLPNDAECWANLGQAEMAAGRPAAAISALTQALALQPNQSAFRTQLGNALSAAGRFSEAITEHETAIRFEPKSAEAWLDLATTLRHLPWRQADALRACEHALQLRPDMTTVWDVYLALLAAHPDATTRRTRALVGALRFAAQLTQNNPPRARPPRRAHAATELRVGLLVSDCRESPIRAGLVAMLPHLAAQGIALHCFLNRARREAIAASLANLCPCTDITELSDAAAAEHIRVAGIDLFIDLAAESPPHRRGIFVHAPAAVTASWAGWQTTGLPQIDWFIGDERCLPESEAGHFVEAQWRIPGPCIVQRPPDVDLPARLADTEHERPFTFGGFGDLATLSTQTLDLWANVLTACPESLLLLKLNTLNDEAVARTLVEAFVQKGVSVERVRVESSTDRADALSAHHRIDVLLDAFPITGSDSLLDSLWMGVPILTLAGQQCIEHRGESLLHAAGQSNWIAHSDDHYIQLAMDAVAQRAFLRADREAMRQRVRASPLFDVPAMAGRFAAACHGMMRTPLPPRRLPEEPAALHTLATVLLEREDWDEAARAWQALLDRVGEHPSARGDAMAHLGIALQGAQRPAEAVEAYRAALPLLEAQAGYTLHLNLGACLFQLHDYDAAIFHAEQAARFQDNDPIAWRNAGSARLEAGDVEGALAAFGRSNSAAAASGYLYALNFRWPPDPVRLRDAHQKWGTAVAQQQQRQGSWAYGLPPVSRLSGQTTTPNSRKTDRRAATTPDTKPTRPRRIGLVSADFRQHPVAIFLRAWLFEFIAQEQGCFEVYAYSDVATPDAVTASFQEAVTHWYATAGWSNRQLAERVRADEIDVLIDLASHTNERAAFFAFRHAAIQWAYLGYSATTGSRSIDGWITDSHLDPPGFERQYVEPLLRIDPCCVTYTPPTHAPAVTPLPALRHGHLTLASFNKAYKINAPTVAIWARFLHACPTARLLLVARGFDTEKGRARVATLLAAEGVAPDRLRWNGQCDFDTYLALHNDIDLAVDCLPWSGHTVTLHAAWMGVPTLTLAGPTHVGRFGHAVTTLLGLDAFSATTENELVEQLRVIATTTHELSELRAGLRERLRSSDLCDHGGLALRFGDLLRQRLMLPPRPADPRTLPP